MNANDRIRRNLIECMQQDVEEEDYEDFEKIEDEVGDEVESGMECLE
jgi:hypothetical protein